MKKILVLVSSVMVAGCFICHRTEVQKNAKVTTKIVAQRVPVSEDLIINRYTISEAANFKFDSKEPRPNESKIDEIIADIQAHPDTIVYIEGHTDSIGPEEYNKDLSLNRASSVAEELIKKGVSIDQIRIHGAGSSSPIASNNTEEGRARNRRVDVVLVKN